MSEDDLEVAWDASNLRAVMAARRVTQREMARLTGFSESAISAYMQGKTAPSVSRLATIAGHLGVRVVDLLPESAR